MAENQYYQKTIDELSMDILADEAQMIRCLKVFFCKALTELSEDCSLSPEEKARAAKKLISAAAEKETALAAVLEAISVLIDKEPEGWTVLTPGSSYQVTSASPTISMVSFFAKTDTGVTEGRISVMVDGTELGGISGINDMPMSYTMGFGGQYPVESVTLKNTGAVTVYIRNVTAN